MPQFTSPTMSKIIATTIAKWLLSLRLFPSITLEKRMDEITNDGQDDGDDDEIFFDCLSDWGEFLVSPEEIRWIRDTLKDARSILEDLTELIRRYEFRKKRLDIVGRSIELNERKFIERTKNSNRNRISSTVHRWMVWWFEIDKELERTKEQYQIALEYQRIYFVRVKKAALRTQRVVQETRRCYREYALLTREGAELYETTTTIIAMYNTFLVQLDKDIGSAENNNE